MELELTKHDMKILRTIGLDKILNDLSVCLENFVDEDGQFCASDLDHAFILLERKVGLNLGEDYYFSDGSLDFS